MVYGNPYQHPSTPYGTYGIPYRYGTQAGYNRGAGYEADMKRAEEEYLKNHSRSFGENGESPYSIYGNHGIYSIDGPYGIYGPYGVYGQGVYGPYGNQDGSDPTAETEDERIIREAKEREEREREERERELLERAQREKEERERVERENAMWREHLLQSIDKMTFEMDERYKWVDEKYKLLNQALLNIDIKISETKAILLSAEAPRSSSLSKLLAKSATANKVSFFGRIKELFA